MNNFWVISVLVFSLYLHFTNGLSFRDKVFCEENGAFPDGILDCSGNELIHVERLTFYSGSSCPTEDKSICGSSLNNNVDGLAPNCTTKGSCKITLPSKPSDCRGQVSITVNYRCVEEKVYDVCEPILDSKTYDRMYFSTLGYPQLSPLDSQASCTCDIMARFVTLVTIIDLTLGPDNELLVLNDNVPVFNKTSTGSSLRVYNEKKNLEYSKSLRIIFNQQKSTRAKVWIEVEGISMNVTCNWVNSSSTTESTRSSKVTTTSYPSSTSTTTSSTTTSAVSSSRSSTSVKTLFSHSSSSLSTLFTDVTKSSSLTTSSTKSPSTSKPSSSPFPTSSSTSSTFSSSSSTVPSSSPSSISSSQSSWMSQSTTSSSRSSTMGSQTTTPSLDNRGISFGDRRACGKDGKFPVLNITCTGDGKINIDTITYYSGSTCDAADRAQCGPTLTNSSNGLAHDCSNRTFCGVYVPDKPEACNEVASVTVNYRCITDPLYNICGSTIIVNTTNRLFLSTPGYPQLSPFNKDGQCSCYLRGSNITYVNLVDLVLENSTVNVADGAGRNLYNEGDINSRRRLYNVKIPLTSTTNITITFQHREGSFQKLWIEVQGTNMVSNCSSENITTTSYRPNVQTSPSPRTEQTSANPTSSSKSTTKTGSTPISREQTTSIANPTHDASTTLSTKRSVTTSAPAPSTSNLATSTSTKSIDSASSTAPLPTKSSGQVTSSTKSSGQLTSLTAGQNTRSSTLVTTVSSGSVPQSSSFTDATASNSKSSLPPKSEGPSPSFLVITNSQTTTSTNQNISEGTAATSTSSSTASPRITPSGPLSSSNQISVSYQPSSTPKTEPTSRTSTSSSTVITGGPATISSPSSVKPSSTTTTISSRATTKDDDISRSSTMGSSQLPQVPSSTEGPASSTSHQDTSSTINTGTTPRPSTETSQGPIITKSTKTTDRSVSEPTSSQKSTATTRVTVSSILTGQTSSGFRSSVGPGLGSSVAPGPASSGIPGSGPSVGSVTDASVKPEEKSSINPNFSQVRPASADTTTLAIVGSIAGFFLLICLLVAIIFYRRRKDRSETPIVDNDTESETGTTSFEVPYNSTNGTTDNEETEVKQPPKPLKSILKKSPSNSANPSPRSSSHAPGVLSLEEESGYSTVFYTPQSAVIPSLDVSPKSLTSKNADPTSGYSESDYATVNQATMIKNRQPSGSGQPSSSSDPTGSYEITTQKPVSNLEEKKPPTTVRLPSRSSRYGESDLTIYY